MTAEPVDVLAQLIRVTDGTHSLGAGALAEAIVEAGWRPPPATTGVCLPECDGERVHYNRRHGTLECDCGAQGGAPRCGECGQVVE